MSEYTKEEMEERERKSRGIPPQLERKRLNLCFEDIKILDTLKLTQVKEWCEQELELRSPKQQEAINRLKAIRNYPEGSFEHMVNLEQLNDKN